MDKERGAVGVDGRAAGVAGLDDSGEKRGRQGREGAGKASEVVQLSIPPKWSNFLIRLLNLRMGRYLIVLTIGEVDVDWSVSHVGKVEK